MGYKESVHGQPKDNRDEWENRVGWALGQPIGYHAPLGHVYSLLLEELARSELDANPESKAFLRFIEDQFDPIEYYDTPNLSDKAYQRFQAPIRKYMFAKGLNPESVFKLETELYGHSKFNVSELQYFTK